MKKIKDREVHLQGNTSQLTNDQFIPEIVLWFEDKYFFFQKV